MEELACSKSGRVLFILIASFIASIESRNQGGVNSLEQKVFVRSFHSLQNLAIQEKILYQILKDHNNNLRPKLTEELTSYLDDYKESYVSEELVRSRGQIFETVIAGHPILSCRMVYRYVKYLTHLRRELNANADLISACDKVGALVGWPTSEDLNGIWEAILRLHHVHDLKVAQIVNGRAFKSKVESGLRVEHCYELGKFAVSEGFFALAVDWFEAAIEIVVQNNMAKHAIEIDKIENGLQDAFIAHDLEWDKAKKMEPMLFKDKLINVPEKKLRVKRRTHLYSTLRGQRGPHFNHMSFWGLCSGDDLRTEEEKSKLFCWLDKTSNPFWYINPQKIERLAWYPDVVQIYNVIPDTLISKLIREGEPRLLKSTVHKMNGTDSYSKHRTSATAWLDESQFPELASIPGRIELMTGLVVASENSSEMMQVAAYSFGMRYEVHKDALENEKDPESIEIGDRIATFMIYLNDVEMGGFTAFPEAGIAARPIKGSAVFWYNLKQNGETDENSFHGGCPILVGHKWIANKWIRANNQFLSRSCSLNANE